MAPRNRVNQRFGMLVVESYDTKKKNVHFWNCVCDCGVRKSIRINNLVSGNTTSCGCQEKRARDEWRESCRIKSPHSLKLQNMYDNMRKRCNLASHKDYYAYGGRGIKICDEWLNNRRLFYDWALSNGVTSDLTLDRKDVNGDYTPENCRFASLLEQANNKRNTRKIEYIGVSRSISEWAVITGMDKKAIAWRFDKGWPAKKIFEQPIRRQRKA